jgi:hypothetical protein
MQSLEVSCAVRHVYIYIYIYIRRQRVNELNHYQLWLDIASSMVT